jgi:hypothetical protein
MGKKKARKRVSSRFQIGNSGGCEALLYEFCERARSSSTEDPRQQPSSPHEFTMRIAATTFDEAFAYLRWAHPDFVIDNVICLGLIRMVSGLPVD